MLGNLNDKLFILNIWMFQILCMARLSTVETADRMLTFCNVWSLVNIGTFLNTYKKLTICKSRSEVIASTDDLHLYLYVLAVSLALLGE